MMVMFVTPAVIPVSILMIMSGMADVMVFAVMMVIMMFMLML